MPPWIALFGLRNVGIMVGVAAVALLAGGFWAELARTKAELSGIAGELEVTRRLLTETSARADANARAVQASRTAISEATDRCKRAQSTVSAMADTERRLRDANERYRRLLDKRVARQPTEKAHCAGDVLDDTLDLMREWQTNNDGRGRPDAGAGKAGRD